MKRGFLLLFLLVSSLKIIGQVSWKMTPKIERNAFTTLEGSIDNKYPISMHLEYSWNWCGPNDNHKWNPRIIKGWYQYNKFGKRIPLLGSIDFGDMQEYTLKLFVPESVLDTLDSKTCLPSKFKEMFFIPANYYGGYYSLDTMQWSKYGQEGYLEVYLKETHPSSWKTSATLNFQIDGIELLEFDLSKAASNDYIDYVSIQASKEVDGIFYFIIEWDHPSTPGWSGSGSCGSGQEGWIGLLVINNHLEISKFEYYQNVSCIHYIDIEYSFDKEHPENGISMQKY